MVLKNKLETKLGGALLAGGLAAALAFAPDALAQESSSVEVGSGLAGPNGMQVIDEPVASVTYGGSRELGEGDLSYFARWTESMESDRYNGLVTGTYSREFDTPLGEVRTGATGTHVIGPEVWEARASARFQDAPGAPELGYTRDNYGGEYYDASVRASGEGPYGTEWSARATQGWGDDRFSRFDGTLSREVGDDWSVYGRVTASDSAIDGEAADVTTTVGVRRSH